MEAQNEEDNSMYEKILTDIYNIYCNDTSLREFSIVPTFENKNKSPVLHQNHNLGLESWCLKHVYWYLHNELLKVRKLLRKNKLPWYKSKKLDKLLVSGLLINPEVQTFWNMRRELIEYGEINLNRELQFIKLVLSCKSKSSEAFAYRKWILQKLLKNFSRESPPVAFLIQYECNVCKAAAEKSPNNYHAWSHRLWCIENMAVNKTLLPPVDYLNLLMHELDFSQEWIEMHVSEHCGYHYRQYLWNSIFNNSVTNAEHEKKYYNKVAPHLSFSLEDKKFEVYLENLLGQAEALPNVCRDLLNYNYTYYFNVLLFDLLYFLPNLEEFYVNHEVVWYYRRFVIGGLLKGAYKYHNLDWKQGATSETDGGEKHPKLFKYDLNQVESSYLYRLIIEKETDVIQKNIMCKGDNVKQYLATRHQKWLKCVMHIDIV